MTDKPQSPQERWRQTAKKWLDSGFTEGPANDYLEAATLVDQLIEQRDQLSVQLAGCGALALGYSSGENAVKQGDYGWSASYGDVERLVAERDKARALLNAIRMHMGHPNPGTHPWLFYLQEMLEGKR